MNLQVGRPGFKRKRPSYSKPSISRCKLAVSFREGFLVENKRETLTEFFLHPPPPKKWSYLWAPTWNWILGPSCWGISVFPPPEALEKKGEDLSNEDL